MPSWRSKRRALRHRRHRSAGVPSRSSRNYDRFVDSVPAISSNFRLGQRSKRAAIRYTQCVRDYAGATAAWTGLVLIHAVAATESSSASIDACAQAGDSAGLGERFDSALVRKASRWVELQEERDAGKTKPRSHGGTERNSTNIPPCLCVSVARDQCVQVSQ
jgi:hypothetical protein